MTVLSASNTRGRLVAGAMLLALLIGLFAMALAADAMLLAMVATAAEPPSSGAERQRLSGDDIAIYDLAGEVRLEPTDGHQVIVTITRGGRDAGRLAIETGRIGTKQTLRVIFPGDRIVYRGRYGSTNLRVRDDGTFGGNDSWLSAGRRVTIAGSGSGTEAHADLRVSVPRGQRLTIHLAAGLAQVTNVDGDIEVNAASADVAASGTHGKLGIDTGSGEIRVTGARGGVSLDTGSGSVTVSRIEGSLAIDTGSGNIEGSSIEVDRLNADTGSGDIELTGVSASQVSLDTGSGSVTLDLTGDVRQLGVDTGSGDITLRVPQTLGAHLSVESSSGGIRTDLPLRLLRKDGDSLEGVLGDGRGQIALETGSGSVRLLAR